MRTSLDGHAKNAPIASPTNVASETSSGIGNNAPSSKAISIDTFKYPEGSGL